MDKTTRFTLIATALLGILLYAIWRFEDDLLESAETMEAEQVLSEIQSPVESVVNAPPTQAPEPGLPRIGSDAELVALLDERGLNGRLLVDLTAGWYAERGFLGIRELFGITLDNAPDTYYDTFDEATLRAMSDGGDAGATQTLARLTMFRNPFESLELYQKAVGQGSVFALIKVADTLSLLADARLLGNGPDRELFRQLRELQQSVPRGDLHTEAYATMLAAISDGGPPIVDEDILNWVSWLEGKAPQGALELACMRSSEILLASSGARRDNGVTPLSITPPPVFISPPEREERMPCTATGYPLVSMMNLSDCSVERVVTATNTEADLYICGR